jgi:hypothetical protein
MIASSRDDLWKPVERVSIVTPLGIRFWDPVFDVPVEDSLSVTAYPFGTDFPATTGRLTASGVYAFHGLPGLHDVEYPRDDPSDPGSLPASRRFQIVVTDSVSRFLPVSFAIDAPFRGIFPTDVPQGPGMTAAPGFYLFSAPTRSASPLVALIRAQLSERLNATDEQAAAYAVIELDAPGGDTWIGIADQRGAVALLFPYPTFTGPSSTSLPATLPSDGGEQSWPVTLRVRYQPSVLSFPAGSRLPELRSVLAQAHAAIWTERAVPPGQTLPALSANLVFGQELVMRSTGEAVLLIGLGSLP